MTRDAANEFMRGLPSVVYKCVPVCSLQGRNGAVSVIALAERGALFDPGPCMYMEKLAGNPHSPSIDSLSS